MAPRYNLLLNERQRLTAEGESIFAKAESEGRLELTADERVKADAIQAKVKDLDGDIDREEQRRARALAAPSITEDAPVVSGMHDRAVDRPWGYDTYHATLPEFMAKHPQSYVAQDHQRHPRNMYQSAGFGEFLRAVHHAAYNPHDVDRRLIGAATGMSEGVPADGGFLVQTDFRETILEKVYSIGEITRRLRPDPIGPNANGIAIPMIAESSRADGSRWGGVRGYWTGEATAPTASAPKFGKFRLDLDKVAALVYVTDEELQDIPFLGSLLGRLVPEELTFKLEDGIMNGSGAGMPIGIVGADCTVQVTKETGQAAATVVMENIVKMYARLWARSQQNAVWLINQDVLPQLFTLSLAVGTGGAPVFMPAGGLSGSPYNTLLGRPILPVEYCQTLGTAGDIMLADFSQYELIDKGGINQASSIHVQFAAGETAFRFTYRVNGAPWWTSALTPKNGTSNTVSPFVKLATRS